MSHIHDDMDASGDTPPCGVRTPAGSPDASARPNTIRGIYRQSGASALAQARSALEIAQFYGYRTDRLACAVADLRGALRNVDAEDAAAVVIE